MLEDSKTFLYCHDPQNLVHMPNWEFIPRWLAYKDKLPQNLESEMCLLDTRTHVRIMNRSSITTSGSILWYTLSNSICGVPQGMDLIITLFKGIWSFFDCTTLFYRRMQLRFNWDEKNKAPDYMDVLVELRVIVVGGCCFQRESTILWNGFEFQMGINSFCLVKKG